MPINNWEIINMVREVAEDANITVTVTESGKGALIAGACAFVGGLIAGPVGLGIGGVIGAVSAAVKGAGKYKSVPYIIMYEMTPQQRDMLATSMRRILNDIQAEDSVMLLAMVMSTPSLKALLIKELGKFLSSEMGLTLSA